ncbi:hypothetical protein DBR06_SOUSAS1110204, partial [Sousa chinensis]
VEAERRSPPKQWCRGDWTPGFLSFLLLPFLVLILIDSLLLPPGQQGPYPHPPNVGYPGGCNPAHPPPATPTFPPGPFPTPPGAPQGNPAFPPGGPCHPVPPGYPGCQPSGPYPPPYPPPAPGMCPVNPLAPGMVGPGMVIDKKMQKKMRKAHKK